MRNRALEIILHYVKYEEEFENKDPTFGNFDFQCVNKRRMS